MNRCAIFSSREAAVLYSDSIYQHRAHKRSNQLAVLKYEISVSSIELYETIILVTIVTDRSCLVSGARMSKE